MLKIGQMRCLFFAVFIGLILAAAASPAALVSKPVKSGHASQLVHNHSSHLGGAQSGDSIEKHPLLKLLSKIRDIGPVAGCNIDQTLPLGPRDRNAKYMFALDLANSEKMMPQLVTQLVPALLLFKRKNVYISIYESGSRDHLRSWLQVLSKLLDALGVGHTIVQNGERRSEGQERIQFLSKVRNLALEPLYDGTFDADRVFFINDVTFCSQDIIRLVQHDADFVCGVDLWNWAGLASPNPTDFKELTNMIPATMLPIPRHLRLYLNNRWQRPAMVPTHGVRELQFYDNWVAHDIDGQRFRIEYPYTTVNASGIRSRIGLPFAVQCCWNGMAVFDATPLKRGLRFRSNAKGECYQSECSLLCDDYWRLGFKRFLVDPSVRVTYCPSMHPFLRSNPEKPVATWKMVSEAPQIVWSDVKAPVVTDCCEGGRWDLCAHNFKWMDKNYTDIAFKSNFSPSDVCYKYKGEDCRPPQ